MIQNYFAVYKPDNYEIELRNYFNNLQKENIQRNKFIEYGFKNSHLKKLYSDIAIQSICLELNLFRERLQTIKTRSPDRIDLIKSYEGTIESLEILMDFIRNIQNDFEEYRISRQRNSDLEIKILMQEKEIEELKKRNEELINLI